MRKSSLSMADHELDSNSSLPLTNLYGAKGHPSMRISSLKGVGEIAPRLQPMHHDRSLEPMRVASFLCMNKNILTRGCWYCGLAYYIGEEGGCGNSACAATLVSYLLMGMVTLAPLFNSTNCNEFRVPHDCIMQVCAHNETMDK